MRSLRKSFPIILGIKGQGGSLLVELMVAVLIFSVVVAAVAFYFIYHVGSINNGRAQLKLQRVGSLLMEEMARAFREAKTTDLPEEGDSKVMIYYPDVTRTQCFSFDDINKDIKGGTDYDNLSPMEVLDDSHIVGSDTRTHRILCDSLGFEKQGDRVTIRFRLIHDLETEDTKDDLEISFGSTVKLRG